MYVATIPYERVLRHGSMHAAADHEIGREASEMNTLSDWFIADNSLETGSRRLCRRASRKGRPRRSYDGGPSVSGTVLHCALAGFSRNVYVT